MPGPGADLRALFAREGHVIRVCGDPELFFAPDLGEQVAPQTPGLGDEVQVRPQDGGGQFAHGLETNDGVQAQTDGQEDDRQVSPEDLLRDGPEEHPFSILFLFSRPGESSGRRPRRVGNHYICGIDWDSRRADICGLRVRAFFGLFRVGRRPKSAGGESRPAQPIRHPTQAWPSFQGPARGRRIPSPGGFRRLPILAQVRVDPSSRVSHADVFRHR